MDPLGLLLAVVFVGVGAAGGKLASRVLHRSPPPIPKARARLKA